MLKATVLTLLVLTSGCIRDDGGQEQPIDWAKVEVKPTTTVSTSTLTTITYLTQTTIQCPTIETCVTQTTLPCPEPTCACVELDAVTIQEALNAHPSRGVSSYQAGWMDAKDYYLELFDVPGRPKFKSRPSMGYNPVWYETEPDDELISFRLTDYCFTLNRTSWGWNDEQCLGSRLQVCRL